MNPVHLNVREFKFFRNTEDFHLQHPYRDAYKFYRLDQVTQKYLYLSFWFGHVNGKCCTGYKQTFETCISAFLNIFLDDNSGDLTVCALTIKVSRRGGKIITVSFYNTLREGKRHSLHFQYNHFKTVIVHIISFGFLCDCCTSHI